MSTATETGFELHGEKSSIRKILRDLWASRDLIKMLARKDFFVRYRRASFGLIWVVALPLFQALVLAAIFSKIARFRIPVSAPGAKPVPFAVYMFSGLIPWAFFTSAISTATTSIVEGGDLATRVYFPRMVLPLVTIASGIRGYIPTIGVLIILAAALGAPLGVDLLLLIPATLIMLGLSTGFAFMLAPLYVYFRDMKYIVAASIFPWFWASGVIFPLVRLCDGGSTCAAKHWLDINPAVGMLEIYRASIGAAAPGFMRPVLISVVWIVCLIALSLPLYRRYDRVFIDLM